jgi:phage anti-repressor protein
MQFSHELAMEISNSGSDFPVDFDRAWKWIGYSRKADALIKLKNNFDEGLDYFCGNPSKNALAGRPSRKVFLSVDCFKSFAMMAGTEQGKLVRRYFLDCEKAAKQKALPTRAEIIATLLPAQPLTWQCRYTPVFWERLDALYTYKQGNIACAHWINRFVYGYFPQEIRDRLDEINPLIGGKRKRLQHTHFDGELLLALEQHLGIVFNFMLAAATASEFERLMDAKFRGIYQLQIWRAA